MSVQYVAVYEEGGNSTPTGTATATGQVTNGGLCLANKGALDVASNPIIADSCDGDAGQQWSPYTDGTVRTQGGCLDVVSAGTTAGTTIDWYPCNASNAQNWTHESNGELMNPNSGLCLTDPGGNPSAQLELETCTDSAAQVWNLPSGGGDRQHGHGRQPGQPDLHRRHGGQPADRRDRLGLRPDAHLQRQPACPPGCRSTPRPG